MSFSSCFVSSNVCKGCRDAVGGVKNVYVIAGCVTGTTENADQEILTVGGSGGTVFQFQVEKNTSNFVETIQASLENGTVVYNQIVNLVFLKLQQSTRNQIKLLAQNTDMKVFVETNEGDVFYLGEDFGMALQTGTAETGTAFADRYGYTVVLEAFEKEPAKKLANSLSSTLVGFSLASCAC